MTRSEKIMQSKHSNSFMARHVVLGAVASVAMLLALAFAASAQAEGPFAIKAGSFATDITTTQAGAHPDLRTKFRLETTPDTSPPGAPAGGTPRDLEVVLPKGLLGSATSVPTCPLRKAVDFSEPCPAESAVGVATATLYYPPVSELPLSGIVYSVNPYPGEPAAFAFNAIFPVRLDTYVRPDGDYGITTTVTNITEAASIVGANVTLWGVPADHQGPGPDLGLGGPSGNPRIPLLTNPTECTGNPLSSVLRVNTWQVPVQTTSASYSIGAITGCDQVKFNPTISAKPTTNLADAPSGLDFNLHMPQSPSADENATSHLRDATVTLPEGMTVNPSSANGLGACAMDQVGISASGQPNGSPVRCPDSSKLGTINVLSPAIGHPLPGSLYLATQGSNPFNSLLALYLVVDDPQSGILVKLAGKVEPNQANGQLTVSFKENPQLPIEDLNLSLFQGPRAALKTPASCGTYTTNGTLVPWSSGQGVPAASSFALSGGPSGGACPPAGSGAPNKPSFSAGTLDPTAKAFTPFVMKLVRADGTQQLKSIDATLPKGLLGKLAGIPYCSDADLSAAAGKSGRSEQGSASCPAQSQLGSVAVGAGAGTDPIYVTGKAYLAGPYKGAPLSLAIITPAVAGPFDLGTVVVRTALNVDPESAQIHAVSDPIPTILQGIPLDVRSIALSIDRSDFTLNPTSCQPTQVLGQATSVFDQSASLSDRFQVGDCGRLGFKPKLAIALKGGSKRGEYPALTATLNARPGDSNIASAVVSLPHSEFLAQNHIRTICTRVQYAANACPAGSVYGTARAISPLLDKPLEGPVYLRSSSNKLPDLVASLRGQIDIDLVGRIDSQKGGIRTTFASVPDAPVTNFVLRMQGGKKGLLENSRNICRTTNKASVQMTAQSGAEQELSPALKVKCKKAKKAKKGKKGKR